MAEQRSRIRRLVFGNLWRTLGGLLGLMQALIVQWLAVVALGGDGLATELAFGLAVVLLMANLATIPILRRARMVGGEARRLARLYMASGISTLLVGLAVAVSWLGIFPITSLLGWLGLGSEPAFMLFRVLSSLRCFLALPKRHL